MKGKISARQAGIIFAICVIANKFLLLPSLMYETAKSDSIFIIIAVFALEMGILPLLFKIKRKYPDYTFFEILKENITKIGAKIVYLVILLFALIKAVLIFSVVYVYFKTQIYQSDFVWVILLASIVVTNHAVSVGLKSWARTMELMFVFIVIAFMVCFGISAFTHISTPVFFTAPAGEFFSCLYKFVLAFGDFIFLFVVIDKLDIRKGQEKKVYSYGLIAMGIVLTLFFIFYSKYNVTAFMHNNALADLLVFSIQFNAIGRLDVIAMVTIMIVTLFQIEIYSHAFCECFLGIFPKLKTVHALVTFDILYSILYYVVLGGYEVTIKIMMEWMPILGCAITYLMPLIFLIIAFKRRKNERKDKNIP